MITRLMCLLFVLVLCSGCESSVEGKSIEILTLDKLKRSARKFDGENIFIRGCLLKKYELADNEYIGFTLVSDCDTSERLYGIGVVFLGGSHAKDLSGKVGSSVVLSGYLIFDEINESGSEKVILPTLTAARVKSIGAE